MSQQETFDELSTEQRIFNAAHEEFIHKGLDGAKMQDIANRAGINKALLHYYFRTKDKLFEAVVQKVMSSVLPALREILEGERPLMEKLDHLVDMYVDTVSRNTFVPLFVITEMNKRPDRFFQKIFNGGPPKPQKLKAQIDEAVLSGQIRPISPVHLITNVFSMCVFPFLAKPMIQTLMGMDSVEWKQYVSERKAEIKHFVHNALKP